MELDQFSRPALAIVDMQNDFVRLGAPLEVPEARPTIAVHQALLGPPPAARAAFPSHLHQVSGWEEETQETRKQVYDDQERDQGIGLACSGVPR